MLTARRTAVTEQTQVWRGAVSASVPGGGRSAFTLACPLATPALHVHWMAQAHACAHSKATALHEAAASEVFTAIGPSGRDSQGSVGKGQQGCHGAHQRPAPTKRRGGCPTLVPNLGERGVSGMPGVANSGSETGRGFPESGKAPGSYCIWYLPVRDSTSHTD